MDILCFVCYITQEKEQLLCGICVLSQQLMIFDSFSSFTPRRGPPHLSVHEAQYSMHQQLFQFAKVMFLKLILKSYNSSQYFFEVIVGKKEILT